MPPSNQNLARDYDSDDSDMPPLEAISGYSRPSSDMPGSAAAQLTSRSDSSSPHSISAVAQGRSRGLFHLHGTTSDGDTSRPDEDPSTSSRDVSTNPDDHQAVDDDDDDDVPPLIYLSDSSDDYLSTRRPYHSRGPVIAPAIPRTRSTDDIPGLEVAGSRPQSVPPPGNPHQLPSWALRLGQEPSMAWLEPISRTTDGRSQHPGSEDEEQPELESVWDSSDAGGTHPLPSEWGRFPLASSGTTTSESQSISNAANFLMLPGIAMLRNQLAAGSSLMPSGSEDVNTETRATTILKQMLVLDDATLDRYNRTCILQADTDEDRERGASCSICWETLQQVQGEGDESQAKAVALPCTHVFHDLCLVPWFSRGVTCPECRYNLDPTGTLQRESTFSQFNSLTQLFGVIATQVRGGPESPETTLDELRGPPAPGRSRRTQSIPRSMALRNRQLPWEDGENRIVLGTSHVQVHDAPPIPTPTTDLEPLVAEVQNDIRNAFEDWMRTAMPGTPSVSSDVNTNERQPTPYVAPKGRVTFEEMLLAREKELGLKVEGELVGISDTKGS